MNDLSGNCPRADFEDCGVLAHGGGRLLASTDLTPVVGVDLIAAGRIAALHAMSDIFASGGTPHWGLVNLVLSDVDPVEHGRALLTGIQLQCVDEHVVILGGQTIVGSETLVGLTVVGEPSPHALLRKRGAVVGDGLFISKPLGVGIVLRGYQLGLLNDEALMSAVTQMTKSNASASRAALFAGAHACTDVSGFGLLGHLVEMLGDSLGAIINKGTVPVLKDAISVPTHVTSTAWIANNRAYASAKRRISGLDSSVGVAVFLDPQTNGGLLVAAPADKAGQLSAAGFAQIGSVTAEGGIVINAA